MAILISDGFDRTEASGWGDAEAGDDTNKTWALNGASSSSVGSSIGVADGSQTVAVVGDSHEEDVEVTVDVAVAAVANPIAVGPAARCAANGSTFYAFGYSDDLGAWVFEKSGSPIGSSVSGAYAAAFKAKLRAQTVDGSVVLSYKKWTSGDEPADWTTGPTDSSSPLLSGLAGIKMSGANQVNTFAAETEAEAEPEPGLPGGAVDGSRKEPLQTGYSRTSLQGLLARGPKLPPFRPIPSSMQQLRRLFGRR
jgi:hypothetical protein